MSMLGIRLDTRVAAHCVEIRINEAGGSVKSFAHICGWAPAWGSDSFGYGLCLILLEQRHIQISLGSPTGCRCMSKTGSYQHQQISRPENFRPLWSCTGFPA